MVPRTLVLSILAVFCVCSSSAVGVPSRDVNEQALRAETPESLDQRAFPVNHLPPPTYSSKKYTVYKELVDYYTAWQRCIDEGKRLASIESYQDQKAYRKAIYADAGIEVAFWTAGTNVGAKLGDNRKFYWITNDRPIGYLSGFENWIEGEAPDFPDLCVATYLRSALWVYGPCDFQIFFVCEESPDV